MRIVFLMKLIIRHRATSFTNIRKSLLFIDHEMLQAFKTVHVKRQFSQEKTTLLRKKQKLARQYAEFYVLMILTSF